MGGKGEGSRQEAGHAALEGCAYTCISNRRRAVSSACAASRRAVACLSASATAAAASAKSSLQRWSS